MFEVSHIAKLARLGLDEREKEKFAKELAAILEFVEKLKEVDTQDIEPTAQITGLQNVSRPDNALQSADERCRKQILSNTPELKGNYIKAKAVFE